MPLIRKRYSRKPVRKIRRGRRLVVARPLKRTPVVHRFKEMCQLADIGASTSSTYGNGIITFKLSDLTNGTSFTNMFDLYKFTYVKIRCMPQFTEVPTQGSTIASQFLPTIGIAPNRSPYVPAPTSMADVLNDDGVKVFQGNRGFTMKLKLPKPEILTSGESPLEVPIQTSVHNQFWLSTGGNGQTVDQSSTKHYGFRWYVDNNNASGNSCVWKVYATYYIACKELD